MTLGIQKEDDVVITILRADPNMPYGIKNAVFKTQKPQDRPPQLILFDVSGAVGKKILIFFEKLSTTFWVLNRLYFRQQRFLDMKGKNNENEKPA